MLSKFFRLMLLLLVFGTISSLSTAAPASTTDHQSANFLVSSIQTADIAITPANHFSSIAICRDHLPGIVLKSNSNNSLANGTTGSQYKQGAKKYLLNSNKNDEDGAQTGTDTNGDDYGVILGQSLANQKWMTAANTWTSDAPDDSGNFSLNINTTAAQTSAPIPGIFLRC